MKTTSNNVQTIQKLKLITFFSKTHPRNNLHLKLPLNLNICNEPYNLQNTTSGDFFALFLLCGDQNKGSQETAPK